MSRLIDAEALKKQVIKGGIYYGTDFIKLIDNAPTITPAMALLNNFDEFYKERIKNGEDIGAGME